MSSPEKKFEATFENGGFWEYYIDLERQFENFLEYVPYLDGNEETYSFKLANLILAIGAHIDSAFKEIAMYPNFSSKYPLLVEKVKKGKPTIKDYHDLVIEYELPQRIVKFKRLPERDELKPFEQYKKINDETITPDWWRVYNKVKHKFKKNFDKANLQNTRNALAGAFLLNVVHKPAIIRLFQMRVAEPKYESFIVEYETGAGMPEEPSVEGLVHILKGTIYPPLYVETKLFSFDYENPRRMNSNE